MPSSILNTILQCNSFGLTRWGIWCLVDAMLRSACCVHIVGPTKEENILCILTRITNELPHRIRNICLLTWPLKYYIQVSLTQLYVCVRCVWCSVISLFRLTHRVQLIKDRFIRCFRCGISFILAVMTISVCGAGLFKKIAAGIFLEFVWAAARQSGIANLHTCNASISSVTECTVKTDH